ncbi:hypothetical protein [Tenacibaculum maritimum]|uniref:hypothetical protein n=1 Tax=Tenacibaculum maritimum TaxID=107401 RepID=UPI0012E4F453|nr:hypothetical protein [Tenacibaculum maritimum]CAA0149626.1 hypothetical protein DPIF89300162_10107 [Tenacibaculum maritimum]
MRKLFLLSVVLLFISCSDSSEDLSGRVEKFFVKVETVCKSGNTRQYQITEETRTAISEKLSKYGSNCTWINIKTVEGKKTDGYYVETWAVKE